MNAQEFLDAAIETREAVYNKRIEQLQADLARAREELVLLQAENDKLTGTLANMLEHADIVDAGKGIINSVPALRRVVEELWLLRHTLQEEIDDCKCYQHGETCARCERLNAALAEHRRAGGEK